MKHALDLPGVGLALICCMLWGGNTVAVKFSVPDVPPMGCAGIRFLLALPIVALSCWISGATLRLRRDQLTPVIISGLFLFAQIATFNLGVSRTFAGRASVLINTHPFVVAPLAWWFLGERFNIIGMFGLTLAAIGVGWLFWEPLTSDQGTLLGDGILVLSAALLGLQTIYQKSVLGRIAGGPLLFWQSVVGVPLFFVASGLVDGFDQYTLTRPAALGLAFQGFAVSGLCFIIWMHLVQHYPVSQLSTFGFLTPLFGVAFASWLRDEPLTWAFVGSTALVGAGIFLVSKGRVPRPRVIQDEIINEPHLGKEHA